MDTFLALVVSGAVTGAIYSLVASGLTLSYAATGIFNFSYGAVAFSAAYLYYIFHSGLHWSTVGAGVVVGGDDASGLELEFGGADAVFDEEDFFGAAVQDFEAAGFVPLEGRLAEFVVLEEFDGEVAEGLRVVVDDVGEVAGDQGDLSVLQLGGGGGLALDFVDDFGSAEHDVDVVVTVGVQKRVGVGGDVDEEDAGLGVLEDQAVVGLGGDFNFFAGLRGEERGQAED